MKLAITVWNGRIAPLFDVAHHVLIVETEGFGNPILRLTTIEMHAELPRQKVETLVAMDVQAVVCGAISREYEEAVLQAGMELDAFVAGDVDDVPCGMAIGNHAATGIFDARMSVSVASSDASGDGSPSWVWKAPVGPVIA